MLLSAVSVLVVAQSSSEIPEGLMNNPVYCVSIIKTILSVLFKDLTISSWENQTKQVNALCEEKPQLLNVTRRIY